VADLERPHHDEVALGDELGIGAFASSVQARVQLALAQAERIERGVVGSRRVADVQ
jgi:hypothetical protein